MYKNQGFLLYRNNSTFDSFHTFYIFRHKKHHVYQRTIKIGNLKTGKMRNFKEKIGKTSFEMVFVEGGRFQMGNSEFDDEKPVHEVTLSDFYLGKYPVTLAEFAEFVQETNYLPHADRGGGNSLWGWSIFKNQKGCHWFCGVNGKPRSESEFNHPVIHVSWNDAVAYTQWLSAKTNKNYCLPNEAQWEYAARGGQLSCDYTYSGSDNLDEVGWYSANSGSNTNPVGMKKPNELGLYDLSGNVWEWCQDLYGNYSNEPQINPTGSNSGLGPVTRGGDWYHIAVFCRATRRNGPVDPDGRYNKYGFRIAFLPQVDR